MKKFNNFINESENDINNIENIIVINTIMKDLKQIDCNIVVNLFGGDYTVFGLEFDKNNTIVKYISNGFRESVIDTEITAMCDEFIDNIYDYLRENFEDYEYLFSGKDMGLL